MTDSTNKTTGYPRPSQGHQDRRTLQPQLEMDREYLKRFLAALRNSVKEARYGVVRADMQIVVDLLNRLDQQIDEAGTRLGLFVFPPNRPTQGPLPVAGSGELLSTQLRLDTPEPPISAKPEFQVGQVWKKVDGKRDFMVWRVEEDAVEIRWCLHGRFERPCRLSNHDLLEYTSENNVRPVSQGQVK